MALDPRKITSAPSTPPSEPHASENSNALVASMGPSTSEAQKSSTGDPRNTAEDEERAPNADAEQARKCTDRHNPKDIKKHRRQYAPQGAVAINETPAEDLLEDA